MESKMTPEHALNIGILREQPDDAELAEQRNLRAAQGQEVRARRLADLVSDLDWQMEAYAELRVKSSLVEQEHRFLLIPLEHRDRVLVLEKALRRVIEANEAVDAWVADDSELSCENVPSAELFDAINAARMLLVGGGE